MLFIAAGSALGGVSRYGLSKLLNPVLTNFPLGTFCINVVGCFIFGFISAFTVKHTHFNSSLYLALTAGFCGSFTTFSTFIFETSALAHQEKLYGIIYACLSLILGFLAIFMAEWLVKKWF